jgi:energy-converting hydrogenase A subunit M
MFNLFKKKKKENTYVPSDKLKLRIINDNADDLAEALGINVERLIDIIDIGLDCLQSESHFELALEKGISKVNHINEVVYLTLIMGRAHQRNEVMRSLKGLV